MSGFTPGPWRLSKDIGLGTFLEGPDGGTLVHNIEPSWQPNAWVGDELATANARLIAAAPELYEAALAMILWDDAEKNARAFAEDKGAGFYARMDMCAKAFTKARAAIAKARGEQ